MTDNILRTINCNKKLTSIFFEETEYFYLYTITLEKDIYKFKMASISDCCEKFGWEYYDHTNKIKRNLKTDFSNFYNLTIKNIEIIHNKDKYDISLKLTFEDNKFIRFGYYNVHDGYYPHRVFFTLFENDDKNGMNILNTYL
jgi:hypothetical protein